MLLESAAVGRPVITSDIPGCQEAVDDGISGYLCKVRDTDSLYEQMRRMASLPPDVRQAMGQAARKKMVQEFEKEQVVHKTLDTIW